MNEKKGLVRKLISRTIDRTKTVKSVRCFVRTKHRTRDSYANQQKKRTKRAYESFRTPN